eukprot:1572673-Amphidinium_carterae.1
MTNKGFLCSIVSPMQIVQAAELQAVREALLSLPPQHEEVVIRMDNKAVFDPCHLRGHSGRD